MDDFGVTCSNAEMKSQSRNVAPQLHAAMTGLPGSLHKVHHNILALDGLRYLPSNPAPDVQIILPVVDDFDGECGHSSTLAWMRVMTLFSLPAGQTKTLVNLHPGRVVPIALWSTLCFRLLRLCVAGEMCDDLLKRMV